MKIKGLIDEDFVNYKSISMFIAIGNCNWKCCKEANIPITVCQNSNIAKQPDIEISADEIFRRYISNAITQAIVIGGLEPMLQFCDVIKLIDYFRSNDCNDVFVIYTGYYETEIQEKINQLKEYPNVIIKYGRYKPNNEPHYDEVLGINLISNNQYAERIS